IERILIDRINNIMELFIESVIFEVEHYQIISKNSLRPGFFTLIASFLYRRAMLPMQLEHIDQDLNTPMTSIGEDVLDFMKTELLPNIEIYEDTLVIATIIEVAALGHIIVTLLRNSSNKKKEADILDEITKNNQETIHSLYDLEEEIKEFTNNIRSRLVQNPEISFEKLMEQIELFNKYISEKLDQIIESLLSTISVLYHKESHEYLKAMTPNIKKNEDRINQKILYILLRKNSMNKNITSDRPFEPQNPSPSKSNPWYQYFRRFVE
ncbi:MAG: hypothetical protein OXB84_02965, partial [Halobacteriovoraceae bacterium]|nr:hypothetical protein [Halobacteriovoraceae bacterium]